MGERLFSQMVTVDDVRQAASDAEAWGFPREVSQTEIDEGEWFRLGQDVVWWYEPVEGFSGYWIHLAVRPRSRKRWPVRRWLVVSEALAEILGAERLNYIPIAGGRDVSAYLRRMGWQSTELGMTKVLGV